MGAHFVCKGPEALTEVKRLAIRLMSLDQVVGAA
jgi:hypothetical protein